MEYAWLVQTVGRGERNSMSMIMRVVTVFFFWFSRIFFRGPAVAQAETGNWGCNGYVRVSPKNLCSIQRIDEKAEIQLLPLFSEFSMPVL